MPICWQKDDADLQVNCPSCRTSLHVHVALACNSACKHDKQCQTETPTKASKACQSGNCFSWWSSWWPSSQGVQGSRTNNPWRKNVARPLIYVTASGQELWGRAWGGGPSLHDLLDQYGVPNGPELHTIQEDEEGDKVTESRSPP